MEIFSRGDSLDIFNQDFPHPQNHNWSTNLDYKAGDNDEVVWSMKSLAVLEGITSFNVSNLPGPVKHGIIVEKEDHYLSTTYKISHVFKGRRAFSKYPVFAKSLGEAAPDSASWISEALLYIFSQAISDLQSGNYYRLDPLLFERIQHSLLGIFSRVDQKTLNPYFLIEDLNQRELFIRSSLRPFAPDLPAGYMDTLIMTMKRYENELTVTADLKDDAWIYQVLMPGVVTHTNADSIAGDTLKWKFSLEDFINDDLVITAESIKYSTKSLQILIISGLAVILIILFFWWKGKKAA